MHQRPILLAARVSASRRAGQACQHLFQHIELFYNRQCEHAALGYVSPAALEELFRSPTHIQAA
jgi:transposase InsO family protein